MQSILFLPIHVLRHVHILLGISKMKQPLAGYLLFYGMRELDAFFSFLAYGLLESTGYSSFS
jgi:hypothetical protein